MTHGIPLSSGLILYLLDGEAVLFSERSRQLFGLDGQTTAMLLCLAEGETAESLTARLGIEGGAAEGVRELAAILAGREPPGEEYRPQAFCPDEVPRGGGASPCFRLLTTTFSLNCPDETVRGGLIASLRHLSVPTVSEPDLAVTVPRDGAMWRLCFNGASQGDAMSASMLLPMLFGRLRIHAYQRLPYLLALHAAAVTDGRQTLVLPGLSGSGKSTLTATLLARGFRLFSDETAILDGDANLVTVPLGLGLKSGSWPHLESDYPDLAASPEQVRWDGTRVRYLGPGSVDFARGGDNRRATHLCFPRFQPNGTGTVEPLSPVQTLRYLSETGYQVRGVTTESVEQTLAWLLDLDRFTLTYSSTEEALHLLRDRMTLQTPPNLALSGEA